MLIILFCLLYYAPLLYVSYYAWNYAGIICQGLRWNLVHTYRGMCNDTWTSWGNVVHVTQSVPRTQHHQYQCTYTPCGSVAPVCGGVLSLECISHFLLKCEAHTLPGFQWRNPVINILGMKPWLSSLATPEYMPFIYMYMQEVELGSTVLQLQDTTRYTSRRVHVTLNAWHTLHSSESNYTRTAVRLTCTHSYLDGCWGAL